MIKERLFSSSLAVFGVTGGNANVSLEFGLAEANEIPCAKTANKMTAIPADMVAKVKAAISSHNPSLTAVVAQCPRDWNVLMY